MPGSIVLNQPEVESSDISFRHFLVADDKTVILIFRNQHELTVVHSFQKYIYMYMLIMYSVHTLFISIY